MEDGGKISSSKSHQGMEEEAIKINEQEEDLIYRMHRLVGERWDLIAGRIPGKTAEDIKHFWRKRKVII
ncbi:unnamed protein product [Amaranthus hypochondriacus]